MAIIFFNLPGLLMLLCGAGIAIGISWLVGNNAEGFQILVLGPFVIAFDVTYRKLRADRSWFNASAGGSIVFLPAWQLGIFWIGLGIYLTLTKQ